MRKAPLLTHRLLAHPNGRRGHTDYGVNTKTNTNINTLKRKNMAINTITNNIKTDDHFLCFDFVSGFDFVFVIF